ncbi:MAG TPA: thiamine pyrophosphate-dependent enzyme, partial [Candidatus Acidoferrales bacterium]
DFAAVQKAPLVLVLENNQWAYSTPVRRQVPLENLADRAKAYGMDSYVVDGNDVVAVYTTAKEAVNRCRAGQGPILIEAKTMRMKGHAQHDSAEYVPAEMLAYWKQRDPIERYEKFLMAGKILDAKKKAKIEARIEREVEADREFAEASPLPPPELAEQGVYCDGCHTIAANWVRPKEEVMPPKSGVAPVWKVAAYGEALRPAEFVPAADAASGNGARPVSKLRGKAPAAGKASPKKLARAGAARKVRR